MAKIAFTAGRVAGFKCPAARGQAFAWDSGAPGLGLRATPAGKPAYVFQGTYSGRDVRITIGSPDSWSIEHARAKARELQRVIDEGRDPREIKRNAVKAQAAKKAAEVEKALADKLAAVTLGEVWQLYLEARRPYWGDLHYKDHMKLARAGGVLAKRGTDGKGVTIAMPLHPLMALPLRNLDAPTIEAWAAEQAKTRPTSARLAWRLLKVFLNWCAEQPEYEALLPPKNAAATRKAREALGKPQAKSDALLREQLPAWFHAVRRIDNPVIAGALQVMLLTGARPGEVLSMRWDDVNTQWRGLTIRDKVEGARTIPLTPYIENLLAGLPRRNAMVFSSATAEAGALTAPRKHHLKACQAAGIEGLTMHGLRRSFKSLTEWLEIPAGVVAQIQGHKPSATVEKHYTVRPLDLLRVHHERIEAWILEQAGVAFVPGAKPGKLSLAVSA